MNELSNLELLTTTRAVRRRLDLTRPVDRADVIDCLQVAFQAPNASNQQRGVRRVAQNARPRGRKWCPRSAVGDG